MRLLIVFICIYCAKNIVAQELTNHWSASIPGSQYEQINAMAVAPSGAIYAIGYFQDTLGSLVCQDSEDAFVVKYSKEGDFLWAIQLIADGTNRGMGITVLPNHQVIVGGNFWGRFFWGNDTLEAIHQADAFVAALDSNGNPLWVRQAGGQGYENVTCITSNHQGGIYAVGYFENDLVVSTDTLQSIGLRDIFLWNMDSSGNDLGLATLAGPGSEEPSDVAMDSSGNVFLTGVFRDALFVNGDTVWGYGSLDAFAAKFDNSLSVQWVKSMGSAAADFAMDVTTDRSGNCYLTGWYNVAMQVLDTVLSDRQEEDVFLIKLNTLGDLIWARGLGHFFDERGYGVLTDEANNVYLMGTLDSLLILDGDSLTNRHLNRPTDIFIARFDANGNYNWSTTLGHYYNDFCYDWTLLSNNQLIITGSFQDTTIFLGDTLYSANGYDVFVASFKIDTTTAISRIPAIGIKGKVFPNPSTGNFSITWSSPVFEPEHLYVYNVMGQLVWQQRVSNANILRQSIDVLLPKSEKGLFFFSLESKGTIFADKIWVTD